MKKDFKTNHWKNYLPIPVCEQFSQYKEFYEKAWDLARAHVRESSDMQQTPYMDEAFCDTQFWIWDTCFMSLFCKFGGGTFPGVESLQNFYGVLFENKSMGTVIPTEKEPRWTGAIPGQPFSARVHIADNPPLFAWAEYENALMQGDKEYLKTLLYEKQFLQKEYEWLENLKEQVHLPNVQVETCWIREKYGYKWEGGRSGMDNTPRGRTHAPTSVERPSSPNTLWVDAICQQALSARMIAKLFKILGDSENADFWQGKFESKKAVVNEYYWDKTDQFYYDIDCNDRSFYKVQTIGSYWALTAGIASKQQAIEMAKHLLDENTFGGKVPFLSLARKDADFSPTGKYWRGGVWLPTAYATLKGLAEYGLFELAHELSEKLLAHMWKTYQTYEPHTIWECYAPDFCTPAFGTDDKTVVRPDFCGWSALGPIAIYLEYVLGFHKIDAFENTIKWAKPSDLTGKVGVKNLRFGEIITDIVADNNVCRVVSNAPYTLKINGKAFAIQTGETVLKIA